MVKGRLKGLVRWRNLIGLLLAVLLVAPAEGASRVGPGHSQHCTRCRDCDHTCARFPDGTLVGSLVITGKPHAFYVPGNVIVSTKQGHRRRKIHVGRSGRFSVRIAPGRYRAVGGVPRYGWKMGSCTAGGPFSVLPGRTRRIVVDCRGH